MQFRTCQTIVAASAIGLSAILGAYRSPAAADGSPTPVGPPDAGAGVSQYDVPGVEISGFVNEDGGAGEINAIVPLSMRGPNALLFLGVDAKLFSGSFDNLDNSVFNTGAYLGYRSRLGGHDGVLGIWLGADTLQTQYRNSFQRFIAGAEYFGSRFIARVNGFVPFDDTSDEWTETIRTAFATTTNVYDEKIPKGIDGEVGLRVSLASLAHGSRPGELRAFAGIYDYIGLKETGGDVVGGRARLELDLYPFEMAPDTRLTFEAGYSDDEFSGGQGTGAVRLSVPFGRPGLAAYADGGGASEAAGGGSLKDGMSPPPMASGSSKDLFQPVRRNSQPISVRRLKRSTTVATTSAGGFTLATVCGGPGAQIPLVLDDGFGGLYQFDPVVQGQAIAIETLSNSPVTLDIASWVDGSGQTLGQLLAGAPATINTTVSLGAALITPTLEVEPTLSSPIIPGAIGPGYPLDSASLAINGNSCTLTIMITAIAASDQRLKSDVELLATLPDGTKLYSFRYLESFDPSGTTYVGVMAQDLLETHPEALVVMPNGYYAVRYELIGLRMTTLDAWKRDGLKAVSASHMHRGFLPVRLDGGAGRTGTTMH